ncbi:hypothetical protein [Hymenobacter fodinae]|uniref:Sigma-70 family RNA polymerase sigma factor n=1 Tax=Hymenobacter fodinae TaxID=2510796 RepID=A0A4Z0P749_9BACT|nr:hypothetical protein [Hymenobacter fodinae]TGE08244.1 hypothetical protein EU556_11010 [Hymenobacter fodinae]
MQLPQNDYELQASACLKAAAEHRKTLEPSAIMLAGSEDEGKELYQEAVLRAHDTIQKYGFHGEGYQFYIWRIIKRLNVEQKERAVKQRSSSSTRAALALAVEQQSSDLMEQRIDQKQHLADQIRFELESRFSQADVNTFKLHVNGQSCREIERLTGTNYRSVNRTINSIKSYLSGLFRPAFEGIE